MGTTWRVSLAAPRAMDIEHLRAGIEAVLDDVIAQMSPWEPQAHISRYARLPAGAALPLPPAFANVMRCALRVAERSAGAFDPTLGALVDAWGFGRGQRNDAPGFVAPQPEQLAALPLGWQHLHLGDDDRLLQPGGMQLDLCGIAKGYAVDAVSAHLSGLGWQHHLVDIGGELKGAGFKPDGSPWWVALEPPAPDAALALPATRIALHGLAVATSGDYRRRFLHHGIHQGQPLAHTLDARTRAPVMHTLASVTVLHPSCMWADAWATAIMVLGPQEGLALAENQGLAASLQWREPAHARGDTHEPRVRWREAASTALHTLTQP